MLKIPLAKWNVLWCRGAVCQGATIESLDYFMKDRIGWVVAEIIAEGYSPFYGCGPSAWLEEVSL